MIELEWFTQSVRVGDLKGLPNNPRKITDTERNKLMRSLEKWNVVEIPVCNQDLTLISGNQRVGALVMLGRENEMIDVRVPNRKLKAKEVKELALIGNTHNGEWDFDLLKEHYVELGDLGEFGITMPVDISSFNDEEINSSEKEFKNSSADLASAWFLSIEFDSERDAEELYNRLESEGYQCKIVT